MEFLRRKFILTYTNQRRFRMAQFGERKIVEEARLNWIPIDTQVR